MRFLMKMRMSVEKGNAAIKDPNFGKKMQEMIQDLKPEAAYFAIDQGQRCGYFIVNVRDTSEMPRMAEPFWLAFNAHIEVTPVMTPDDLAKAGPDIAVAVKKYG
ncbi:MAG: DUF3303 family protein [Chloroflexi bacterium]|nr:DUF3303 family protein [Chloroflexota bacterium]